jgi:hypothetical protein
MKMAHIQQVKVLQVLAPQTIAATAVSSSYVDLDQCVGFLEFEVAFGAITATDASTSEIAVTVNASTGGTDTGTAIAFSYSLSEALDTDSGFAAPAAATSSGIVINSSTDDNKLLMIYVDPAAIGASLADGRWVKFVLDGTAGITAALVAGVARYTPRYSQVSMKSST